MSIPIDTHATFDHVKHTLPGTADTNNTRIIVNTHNKNKTKVFSQLVNIDRCKAAMESLIALGNQWYEGLSFDADHDLTRIIAHTDNSGNTNKLKWNLWVTPDSSQSINKCVNTDEPYTNQSGIYQSISHIIKSVRVNCAAKLNELKISGAKQSRLSNALQ